MPKPTLPLTDSQCKKLEPPNQLSDGGGLSLQARGNGKYWRFRYYRPSDNKRDEIRLGIYPAMSLKEAREEREELRGLVARGIDPKLYRQNEAQRQAEQMNNTFEAVARKWHADQAAKPDKWKPDHAGRVIRSLELHIFPDLARRQIGEIMPLEVLGLLQRLDLNATRTAYNHAEYLEQRAEMVQAWADYLDGLKAQSGILQQTGG